MRITIRLTEQEHADALTLASRESTGCENVSEFIRLLLNRERHKHLGLAKPTGKDYSTSFRIGRPKAKGEKPYGWEITAEFCHAMVYIPGSDANVRQTFHYVGSKSNAIMQCRLKPHCRGITKTKPLDKATYERVYGLNQRM
jgi:hypothetical protein